MVSDGSDDLATILGHQVFRITSFAQIHSGELRTIQAMRAIAKMIKTILINRHPRGVLIALLLRPNRSSSSETSFACPRSAADASQHVALWSLRLMKSEISLSSSLITPLEHQKFGFLRQTVLLFCQCQVLSGPTVRTAMARCICLTSPPSVSVQVSGNVLPKIDHTVFTRHRFAALTITRFLSGPTQNRRADSA
jgi:hypothetical protein